MNNTHKNNFTYLYMDELITQLRNSTLDEKVFKKN